MSNNKIDTKPQISKFNPLVSIIVITYNSADYVIETLESVKDQSYQNIELIISDDDSTDNTIEVCRNWIYKNKEQFVRTELLIADKNTGIPGNCNRGVKASKGDWLKLIAGDDMLSKDAIKFLVDFTESNKHVSAFSSNVGIYDRIFDENHLRYIRNDSEFDFFKLSASKQFERLLYINELSAAGIFLKRSLVLEIGGFDERFRFIEDHPLTLNITKSGTKIFYMNKLTTKYRVHSESIIKIKDDKNKIFGDFYLKQRKFQLIYIYPYLNWIGKFTLSYEFYRHYLMDLLKLNRNSFFGRGIHFLACSISPIKIKTNWIKKEN